MKMDKVAGSGNDEFYTPNYAIKPILKYLERERVIWCPFDTEESNFVKMFKEQGFKVINTHCLNPPFSSVYLCSKILPKQIVFEEIVK